jgi:protein pelota
MQIINQNYKKGQVKLRVTEQDDLWYLSQLIDPGDLIKGKTTRKIRIGDGENAKVTKKTLTLMIEAETIDFGSGGIKLRINGKVKEGTDEVPKDSYHSITLEEGSEFSLEKPNWLSYQKQKLKEASEKKYLYLFCLLDREEALFAVSKKFGYEILVKIKGDVPKKNKEVSITKDFHQELLKALEVYAVRNNPEKIILASPAFYKEELAKKIKDQSIKNKIVLANCSGVNEKSLDEVIKRPELKDVLKNSRAREEQLLMDELLAEISKENLATYGWKETKKAIEAGATRTLLITNDYIQQRKKEEKFSQLDELMKQVDALQGKIKIISAELESGKKLNGLGGIAALLRYKI